MTAIDTKRRDFAIIAGWVGQGTRVLDLGCGDGALLDDLKTRNRIRGYGIDIADENVLACIKRGVNVLQSDLESGLAGFGDRSFDTVILSQTLQQIHGVESIINEMLRVGREVIVTFPNFAYWRHRVQLGVAGTMPVSRNLPYAWYNTPNVRMFTVREFDRFCVERGIDVLDREVLASERKITIAPNLLGQLAFYRIREGTRAFMSQAGEGSTDDKGGTGRASGQSGTGPSSSQSGQGREFRFNDLLNRRMLICIFVGFSSGLPLFILINLIAAWLRSEGVDLKAIGLFALIQFPYTWKFIWSPLMDRFSLGKMGRRRGWMLLTQILLLGTVAAFGFLNPKTDLWTIAALAAVLAFFSASQDIVLDAYRREILKDEEQGLGTAIHVNAYKLAGLVPGSLSLILADRLPWSVVFLITALFMLPGIITTLLVDEPPQYGAPPKTLHDAVVLPFREFVLRSGWSHALLVLSFIFLYKLGDSMAVALATPFYLDLGFTKTEIGLIAKNAGLWMNVAGGLIGGIWLVKLGINRGLWVFGVIQAVVILGFWWLAQVGPDKVALGIVIGAEAFGVGLGTAAFTAFIARSTDPRYTATQFALFTSLASVPRTFANASTGYIVAQAGWPAFFLLCTVLAIPGLLLLYKVAPWNEGSEPKRPK